MIPLCRRRLVWRKTWRSTISENPPLLVAKKLVIWFPTHSIPPNPLSVYDSERKEKSVAWAFSAIFRKGACEELLAVHMIANAVIEMPQGAA